MGAFFTSYSLFFDADQLARVREREDPIAQRVPLGKLVRATRVVDVDEIFVVHGDGAHLVVGRRQQLDHVVPALAVLLVGNKRLPLALKVCDQRVKCLKSARIQSVM